MRWLRLWIALAGVYLATRLAVAWFADGPTTPAAVFLVRLAVVPVAQTAALGWVLSRRHRRSRT